MSLNPTPHVLMFPLPPQGHVTPMLKLAELLCLANIKVTFVITACNHKLMAKTGDIEAYFTRYPGFEFKVIPSEIADDVPRIGLTWIRQMITGLAQHAVPFLREMLKKGSDNNVTCFIADAILSYAIDVADELEVPVMEFNVYGASFLWVAFCLPDLIRTDDDRDRLVQNIPGMSDFLRRRDLPSMFQVNESSNSDCERLLKIIPARTAHPIIVNTFEHLEGPYLSLLKGRNAKIYSIGPLDSNLKCRLNQVNGKESKNTGSLLEVDRSCISWLDRKPYKSVVYVAFGTTVVLETEKVMEILAGLVQSNQYFLWALRPETIIGTGCYMNKY